MLAQVIHERRAEHGFFLTAWVFLPDHWHAIFYPQHPLNRGSVTRSGLSADCILLPADEQTRI